MSVIESSGLFSSMERPPLALPLYARRPEALQASIDGWSEGGGHYAHRGISTSYNYFFLDPDGQRVVSSDMAVSRARGEFGRPVRILDVGCAAGGLVLHQLRRGNDADGLTLHDYRSDRFRAQVSPELPDDHYVLGNAEDLRLIEGLKDEYDVVVSRLMLMHLQDPLGTLEQLAEKIAPGGYLLIDYFSTAAIYADMRGGQVKQAFRAADFHDVLPGQDGNLTPAAYYLQRGNTRLPLRFPVEFR